MSRFIKDFLKAAPILTAGVLLAITLQVQVAQAGVTTTGDLLLAQKAEPEKVKTPSPEPASPKLPEAMERSQPQAERMPRRTRSMGPMPDEPAKAGTQRFGGQPIRAKQPPQGE
jgi:hypothetical protein